MMVDDLHDDGDDDGDDDEDEDDDAEAPPLEAAGAGGALGGDLDLIVGLGDVLDRILGVVLGGLNDGVLLVDERSDLAEEVGQLVHSLLDTDHLVVAGADGAEDRGCLAGAVGAELGETCVSNEFLVDFTQRPGELQAL